MKAQYILVMVAALVFLCFDDVSKRRDFTVAETRAEVAEKDAAAQAQEVELLTKEVSQLEAQSYRPAVSANSRSGMAPSWFTDHLNGTPTILDPQGTQGGRSRTVPAMPPP
jgi:hypothetical protein